MHHLLFEKARNSLMPKMVDQPGILSIGSIRSPQHAIGHCRCFHADG